MDIGGLKLTTVHIYIICLKAEVLSQLMAKWWAGLGGHGHLVGSREEIANAVLLSLSVWRAGSMERLNQWREIRLD